MVYLKIDHVHPDSRIKRFHVRYKESIPILLQRPRQKISKIRYIRINITALLTIRRDSTQTQAVSLKENHDIGYIYQKTIYLSYLN